MIDITEWYYHAKHLSKSCVFLCADGEQRASKWILQYSKFFKEKIEGCEAHDNPLKFDYTSFSKASIKTFLGTVSHGLKHFLIFLETNMKNQLLRLHAWARVYLYRHGPTYLLRNDEVSSFWRQSKFWRQWQANLVFWVQTLQRMPQKIAWRGLIRADRNQFLDWNRSFWYGFVRWQLRKGLK